MADEQLSAASIWTEKYRPLEWDQIVGQKPVVERLRAFVAAGRLPHLLFAGPPGCGKSTAALVLAHKLFGQHWRANFLETNASDERGIATIRVKIKDFARTRAVAGPFKLIFLDEADALTAEAQAALRRIMETYASSCRFCLSVNYSNRIIPAIQSRCATLRFRALTTNDIAARLTSIAQHEGLDITEAGLNAICEQAEGDMRKAINILQAAASVSKSVTDSAVYAVAAAARPEEIRNMLEAALAGKLHEARKLLLELLLGRGMSGEDIIRSINREAWTLDVSDKVRARILSLTGEYGWRVDAGGEPSIQISALLAQLALLE
ncbi:MAG: replication factor C small subunit [Candidatus Aenigmatarchaeota archaeon]|nr:replication factor C small subunit [Candidatus Aenigmarchaeota archaeon]